MSKSRGGDAVVVEAECGAAAGEPLAGAGSASDPSSFLRLKMPMAMQCFPFAAEAAAALAHRLRSLPLCPSGYHAPAAAHNSK